MSTSGFFQQNVDPNYRKWLSDENIFYIQKEIGRRMREKYKENISVEFDTIKNMVIHTKTTWKGPLTLNDLLEMVICNYVTDIDTDIEWQNRFNDYNPRTLYFPGTGITREEKVKLNPGYKWEFQMNY